MARITIYNDFLSKSLTKKGNIERKWMYAGFAAKPGMVLTAQVFICSSGFLQGFPRDDKNSTVFMESRWSIPTSSIMVIEILRATPGSPISVETVDVRGLSRKGIEKNLEYVLKKYHLAARDDERGCSE